MDNAITLVELNRLIGRLVVVPDTQNVWVTAELSDVSSRGGHCYMELLQKDPDNGTILAKARAVIWANVYARIAFRFREVTGQQFETGIKVMLRVSASFHPVFGFSLVVSDVNPEFTMGDLLRRRQEILRRLQQEGVLEMNRSLQWPCVVQRIAVISAAGAAGYGDFINQLYGNHAQLKFKPKLFQAVMQGERAVPTILDALQQIAADEDNWDCVVIIRGGGATSDLAAFENYDLAANIAQFPLPVVIGIGHERDVTVLDYVANKRVKTPTAAAEWIISKGVEALEKLRNIGAEILQSVTDRLAGSKEQLSYIEALLPTIPHSLCEKALLRLQNNVTILAQVGARSISSQQVKLEHIAQLISTTNNVTLRQQSDRLDAMERMLNALSPEATLRRGYSITRVNGKVVTSVEEIKPGMTIETTLSDGVITSKHD